MNERKQKKYPGDDKRRSTSLIHWDVYLFQWQYYQKQHKTTYNTRQQTVEGTTKVHEN